LDNKIRNILLSVVGTIIFILIIFNIIIGTTFDLTSAADNISASNLPLVSLFGINDVVVLILLASIFIILYTIVFIKIKTF